MDYIRDMESTVCTRSYTLQCSLSRSRSLVQCRREGKSIGGNYLLMNRLLTAKATSKNSARTLPHLARPTANWRVFSTDLFDVRRDGSSLAFAAETLKITAINI